MFFLAISSTWSISSSISRNSCWI